MQSAHHAFCQCTPLNRICDDGCNCCPSALSYSAPSELIINMTNHHMNHLITTKVHCAPPKCTSVQNYIVNLHLHAVHCEPPNDYILSLRELVHQLTFIVATSNKIGTKSVCLLHEFHGDHQKIKNVGHDPHFYKSGLPCALWCTMQVGGAHNEVVHDIGSTNPYCPVCGDIICMCSVCRPTS